jgi:hypothetical protein
MATSGDDTKIGVEVFRQVGAPFLRDIGIIIALIDKRPFRASLNQSPIELPVDERAVHRIEQFQIEQPGKTTHHEESFNGYFVAL